MIEFHIPGEVVPWARARLGKSAIHFTPARQRSYMGVIRDYAAISMGGRPPLDGPVELSISAFFLYPASWSAKKKAAQTWKSSKPDADNISKITKDALNKIVWLDDAQVASLHIWKTYGDTAGLLVRVKAL